MKITRKSRYSGIERTIDLPVTQEQIDSWRYDGVLVQDAMPHLSVDDREFIQTGIIPSEWEEIFGEDD